MSRTFGKVVGLFLLVILARNSSTAKFAQYSYLLVIAGTVSTITDLGVATVAGRDVARGKLVLAAAYRAALPTQIASNLVAGIVVIIFGSFAPGPGVTVVALFATGVFSFVNGIFDLQTELLRGSGRPMTEATLQVISAVLQTALCSTAVLTGGNLLEVMAMMALSAIISTFLAQLCLPLPRNDSGQPHLQKSLFLSALWLSASTTFLALMMRAPLLMLANTGSTIQIAYLALATRYLDLGRAMCYTLGIGLLPSLARRASRSALDFRNHARRLVAVTTVCFVAATVPAVLMVSRVTVVIFGEKYSGATNTAKLFVSTMTVQLVLYLSWFLVLAERRERWITVATLLGLVATVVTAGLLVIADHTAFSAGLAVVVGSAVCALTLVIVSLAVKPGAHRKRRFHLLSQKC